ncbi:C2 calcium-dependent domain-containing protein 4C-like [Hyla sarda]|uniref:C2 calcium-dependent domain-containing protein 4C-like n=1 Tax=Hyla sarda TaxID=327740 RepID=UPI0024C256E5|nr:C2 calcium-dependent domain-containing protein 4C-like [Hyla sarda]XP_056428785.1 C2 calcium-dependent domain-containing protein 4C-like [Hyla sarda]XP_056428786.1 C2 calcium-dependent domain-containing protein 4C-like [Hyla sarda]XP_056428787.1 C2 calcium-dependent domain-containing protein 4C-like [Hyla sarda]XP_056428789.1 C2 calcium-dependent domain-containing protein 4C-like [Hyla sarda]XP_056428790.1 C2 calcium-dependent domain-containing protein 4C-like [Hyla sarda]
MLTMIGKERPRHYLPTFTNVLTPDRIPEFCIPPRHQSQKELSPQYLSIPDLSTSVFEAIRPILFDTHTIQVHSVEDTLEEENTNADPQSQAALSLPHLPKTQTCYGFCTLLESPNTRRKESLFHNDPANPPILLPRSRSNTISYKGISSADCYSTANLRPLKRSGTLDSDTTSSTDSSPFSSPLLQRSLPMALLKAFNQDNKLSRALKVGYKSSALRNSSVSTDEDSSTDSSPCVTRRASQEWAYHSPAYPNTGLLLSPGQFPIDNTVTLDTGGILRLSTEYRPENLRLRIRIVSAEGLYKQSVDPKNISCYISISLVPGKNQKQRSTLIRGSRNPIFNEDFFFDGLEPQDLFQKTLKIKVLNKGYGVRRENILGKSKLHLLNALVL